MTAIPEAGKQDLHTPPPCVDPQDISAKGSTVTIPRDILQGAIAASGLPTSSSELWSESKIIGETQASHQCTSDSTAEERPTEEVGSEQWKVVYVTPDERVDIPAETRQTATIIGEFQIPCHHGSALTPGRDSLLTSTREAAISAQGGKRGQAWARKNATKSNAAYRKRVGSRCYNSTKQKLLLENASLRARVNHLEKGKAKVAPEVNKVAAPENFPTTGLTLRENSDSGMESEDELVFKPKKKKTQMRLAIGKRKGMDYKAPVSASDLPKSIPPRKPGKLYFRLLQFFFCETERAKACMAGQEAQLVTRGIGDSLDSVEVQAKKYEDFEKTQEERINTLGELAAMLIEVGHSASKELVEESRATLEKRSSQLLKRSRERKIALGASGDAQRSVITQFDVNLL